MGRTSKSTHPVAQVRRVTGLSQREFAEALGISRDHLAKIELGSAPLSETVALRIYRRFGARLRGLVLTPGRPAVPRSQQPVYTRRHYEQWKRRAQIRASCANEPGEAGWRLLSEVVKVIGSALGADLVQQFNLAVEIRAPEGAEPGGLVKRLLVALAKTEGIEVIAEGKSSVPGMGRPDIVVMPAENAKKQIDISIIGMGRVDARVQPEYAVSSKTLFAFGTPSKKRASPAPKAVSK